MSWHHPILCRQKFTNRTEEKSPRLRTYSSAAVAAAAGGDGVTPAAASAAAVGLSWSDKYNYGGSLEDLVLKWSDVNITNIN